MRRRVRRGAADPGEAAPCRCRRAWRCIRAREGERKERERRPGRRERLLRVRHPSFGVGPLIHETLEAVFGYNHGYVSSALSDFPVPRCYEEHGHRGALYAALHLPCNPLLSHKVREWLR